MILVIITNRGGGRNVILTNKRFERRAESKQECTPASINPDDPIGKDARRAGKFWKGWRVQRRRAYAT